MCCSFMNDAEPHTCWLICQTGERPNIWNPQENSPEEHPLSGSERSRARSEERPGPEEPERSSDLSNPGRRSCDPAQADRCGTEVKQLEQKEALFPSVHKGSTV